jgi:hypothetical protein
MLPNALWNRLQNNFTEEGATESATSCATKRCYELVVTVNSFEFIASSWL